MAMYPTEASMAADIKAILPSNAEMISSLQNDLTNGNLSATDRATAQAALATYTGGSTGQYSAPIPGAPDTGPATGGAGVKPNLLPGEGILDFLPGSGGPKKESMAPGLADALASNGGVMGYLQTQIGNITLILMGIIVIAIAIWATTQKQELILKTVKQGVVG